MTESREGYQFVGWFIDEACTKRINPGAILPVTVQLYPKWVPVLYPVHYELHGGKNSGANPKALTIESGVLKLYPASLPGKMFMGWKLDGKRVGTIPENTARSVTLEAVFEKIPTVSFDTAGGGKIQPRETDDKGILAPFRPPMRPGFMFTGWFYDPDYQHPYHPKDRIEEDLTLFANWEEVRFQILYDLDGGRFTRPVVDSYVRNGRTLILPKPEKDGFLFDGWRDERGNQVKMIPRGSMGHRKLKAHWKEHPMEIHVISAKQ